MSDDRGEFRLTGLEPGEYFFEIRSTSATFEGKSSSTPTSGPTRRPDGFPAATEGFLVADDWRIAFAPGLTPADVTGGSVYPTTFYPSASSPQTASAIVLRSGEVRLGLDFRLEVQKAHRVCGSLVAPNSGAGGTEVRLVPAFVEQFADELLVDGAKALADSRGSFCFFGIPSQSYVLSVTRFPQDSTRESIEDTLWAKLPVQVDDADVLGLTVNLVRGARVRGHLAFHGTTPAVSPNLLKTFSLNLEKQIGGRDQGLVRGMSRVQADEAGRFFSKGWPGGKYFIRPVSGFSGWWVESITVNGVDAIDEAVEFGQVDLDFTVNLSDRISGVRGRVAFDSSLPPPIVTLFPVESSLWVDYGNRSRRIRSQRCAADGAFAFDAVPAGEYFASTVDDQAVGAWPDPKVIAMIARKAKRVTVRTGEVITIDLGKAGS